MSIFLSYRRVDSEHALWLYPWLIQWFGPDRVFWDRKHIDPGADFANVIERQIRSGRAFIALVSDNWVSAADKQGNRKIDSPEDWIRRETVLALGEGLLVIPVLVGGMQPPRAEDLPDELQKLASLQMLSMADMSFHDLLRKRLESVIPVEVREPTLGREDAVRLQRRAVNLLRRQTKRLQVRAVELIQDHKLDRATEELHEGSELLMALLDLIPGDTSLDAQLGYLFGATGQAFLRGGDKDNAERYFALAISIFDRVQANPEVFHERPSELASAIKGIGGVFYERGDPAGAIPYYRRALEIYPHYPEAWHDLFAAYNELAKRGRIDIAAMQEALDKTRQTGADQPGFGADKIRMFEQLLRGWKATAAAHPGLGRGGGTGPAVRVLPEFLSVVIAESNPRASAFNLNCRVENDTASSVSVQKLEIQLTGPDSAPVQFRWNVFYDFRPSNFPEDKRMTATGEAQEFEIEAGGAVSTGMQFVGPEMDVERLWGPGEFTFELSGSLSDGSGLKTRFKAWVGADEASDVKAWSTAPKAQWDRLNDPDRAVGIPVGIVRASIAAEA